MSKKPEGKLKIDQEKIDKLNKKVDEFRAELILEDGAVLVPVYPEMFIDETKYRIAQLKFFDSREADVKWAKDIKKQASNIITPD